MLSEKNQIIMYTQNSTYFMKKSYLEYEKIIYVNMHRKH